METYVPSINFSEHSIKDRSTNVSSSDKLLSGIVGVKPSMNHINISQSSLEGTYQEDGTLKTVTTTEGFSFDKVDVLTGEFVLTKIKTTTTEIHQVKQEVNNYNGAKYGVVEKTISSSTSVTSLKIQYKGEIKDLMNPSTYSNLNVGLTDLDIETVVEHTTQSFHDNLKNLSKIPEQAIKLLTTPPLKGE